MDFSFYDRCNDFAGLRAGRAKGMMMDGRNQTIIAEFPKNAGKKIRVSFEDYLGTANVCIRVFYLDAAGEWQQGRGGISMATRHLGELADAIIAARDRAETLGMLGTGQFNSRGAGYFCAAADRRLETETTQSGRATQLPLKSRVLR